MFWHCLVRKLFWLLFQKLGDFFLFSGHTADELIPKCTLPPIAKKSLINDSFLLPQDFVYCSYATPIVFSKQKNTKKNFVRLVPKNKKVWFRTCLSNCFSFLRLDLKSAQSGKTLYGFDIDKASYDNLKIILKINVPKLQRNIFKSLNHFCHKASLLNLWS